MKLIFPPILIALVTLTVGCIDTHEDPAYIPVTLTEEYDPVLDSVVVKAPIPVSKTSAAAVAVGDTIYVIGGTGSSLVHKYDISSDTWSQTADLPAAHRNLKACTVGGKIYVVGGDSVTRITEEYDPATDTWTSKTVMQRHRVNPFAIAVAGDKVYIFGGDLNPSKSVECYDPASDTWSVKTDMPTGRWDATAETVGGKIYVVGGMTAGTHGVGTIEEYDQATDSWTVKADMPGGWWIWSGKYASCVADGKIYVIFYVEDVRGVNAYDPATDTWTQTVTVQIMRRQEFCYASAGNKLYITGGFSWCRGTY